MSQKLNEQELKDVLLAELTQKFLNAPLDNRLLVAIYEYTHRFLIVEYNLHEDRGEISLRTEERIGAVEIIPNNFFTFLLLNGIYMPGANNMVRYETETRMYEWLANPFNPMMGMGYVVEKSDI